MAAGCVLTGTLVWNASSNWEEETGLRLDMLGVLVEDVHVLRMDMAEEVLPQLFEEVDRIPEALQRVGLESVL